MPIANLKCIREVTSEDASFTAANLLKQEPGKKWKTKTVGEKTAYCVFELNKPMQIVGIDIGNEHAAFVEVLVSNSGCCAEDFKEILITCSFMTPFESKNSTNPNRVRCFNQEALVSCVAKEKWHLIKVICTQPFNKHCQYGLSFIKIHVVETENSKNLNTKVLESEKLLDRRASTDKKDQSTEQKPKTFSKFALREESPDSESESSAAMFSRWKKARQNNDIQLTAAAAIRQASTNVGLVQLSQTHQQIPSVKSKEQKISNDVKSLDRNRDELCFSADDDAQDKKSKRLSKHIETEKQHLQIKNGEMFKQNGIRIENKEEKRVKNSKQNTTKSPPNITTKDQTKTSNASRKRRSTPNKNPKQKHKKPKSLEILQYRPFNKLLQGVVLVISGIQNPDRANLRCKALAMGAKYKADWEPGCTHLICAFKNTPKYNQVKGKGNIVTRNWIEKSYDLKKYLPWRRYALDSNEQGKPESDTEILDISLKPTDDVLSDDSDVVERKVYRTPKNLTRDNSESRDIIEQKPFHIDSGSDTDDYIEDIKKKDNDKENAVPLKERDMYEVTTEEEDFVGKKTKAPPMFFANLKFLISDDLKNNAMKNQLMKCIKHYGGSVTSDKTQADYYIVEKFPVDEVNFSGETVNLQWILECNDMEQKIATKPYLNTKN